MSGTFTKLVFHLVFSTKGRLPLIDPTFKTELFGYIAGIITTEGGIPLAIGGVEDHIHLLVRLKPTAALSDTLRIIKSNSSKWVNDRAGNRTRFGWQDGYAAFSVSVCKSELIGLLIKHGIQYDERYIWQ